MSKVKLPRNKELVKRKKKNPKITFKELGDYFNISRVTAYKIFKRESSRV